MIGATLQYISLRFKLADSANTSRPNKDSATYTSLASNSANLSTIYTLKAESEWKMADKDVLHLGFSFDTVTDQHYIV